MTCQNKFISDEKEYQETLYLLQVRGDVYGLDHVGEPGVSHSLHVRGEQTAAVETGDWPQLLLLCSSNNVWVEVREVVVEVGLGGVSVLADPADVGPAGVELSVVSPGSLQCQQLGTALRRTVAALEPLFLARVSHIEVL